MQHWPSCSKYTENDCVLITICDRALQRNYIELLATSLMAALLPQTCQFNFLTTQPSAVLNYTVTLWEWYWHLTIALREFVSCHCLYYVYSKTLVELASACNFTVSDSQAGEQLADTILNKHKETQPLSHKGAYLRTSVIHRWQTHVDLFRSYFLLRRYW